MAINIACRRIHAVDDDIEAPLTQPVLESRIKRQLPIKQIAGGTSRLDVDIDIAAAALVVQPGTEYPDFGIRTKRRGHFLADGLLLIIA